MKLGLKHFWNNYLTSDTKGTYYTKRLKTNGSIKTKLNGIKEVINDTGITG